MKKIFTMVLPFVAMSSFALAQDKITKTGGPGSEEQAVMQLEREIANAYVQADPKTLERIFADELTSTTDYWVVLPKQAVLHTLRPMAGATADVSGLKPRVYDKTAVVTGIVVLRNMNGEADYLSITDTFVKQQKGWQLVASQQHRVPVWMVRKLEDTELKRLVAQDCSQEPSLRSLSYDVPAFIRFTNTTTQPVVVYWLNYQGERDPSEDQKETLKPGQSGFRLTYLTHPFLIADASGKCMGIYQPTREPSLAMIQ